MLKQVDIVKAQFETKIKEVNSLNDLEKIRVEFLGKKGLVTLLMPMLRDVPNEQKREMGQAINALKNVVETLKNGMKQKKEDNKELMQILEKSYKYNEDYIGEYEKALNSVTSDDVRKFVKKILKQDNFIQLIINPE